MDQEKIEQDINLLSAKLETLRTSYEKYFVGVDRRPPVELRKDVQRTIGRINPVHIRNTALKFKYRQIVQRWNTYKHHWDKISRQIEEGTYQKHRNKVARREERKENIQTRKDNRKEESQDPKTELYYRFLNQMGMSKERIDKVYQTFISTKSKYQGGNQPKIETVVKSMAKQAATMKKKNKIDHVDFNVVVKNGKAYLQTKKNQ